MNSVQLLRINVRVVWNKLPAVTPSNSTRLTTLPLGRTDFFNDNFGTLTGTEPLFRGVRVAVIDPFFITCDNSRDKYFIQGITDNLTADIPTLHWACWGVNSWGTDLQLLYDFPRVLSWRCIEYFDASSSWVILRILFCGFSSKILRIFSISHNLDLPERGKSLEFTSPVLKLRNHRCTTHSLINTFS